MKTSDNIIHGLGGTAVAMAIPENLVSLGERWMFAVAVALTTTLMSKLITLVWRKVFGTNEPD